MHRSLCAAGAQPDGQPPGGRHSRWQHTRTIDKHSHAAWPWRDLSTADHAGNAPLHKAARLARWQLSMRSCRAQGVEYAAMLVALSQANHSERPWIWASTLV